MVCRDHGSVSFLSSPCSQLTHDQLCGAILLALPCCWVEVREATACKGYTLVLSHGSGAEGSQGGMGLSTVSIPECVPRQGFSATWEWIEGVISQLN